MNEYSTMYFLNSYFSVSSKGETSILKIEVHVAIHILKIKWREICNHLGFSLTAQKNMICTHQLVFFRIAHISMAAWDTLRSKSTWWQIYSACASHGLCGSLPNQEQTERGNSLDFLKNNCVFSAELCIDWAILLSGYPPSFRIMSTL